MRYADITPGTYLVASSPLEVERDPEGAFVVEVTGPAIRYGRDDTTRVPCVYRPEHSPLVHRRWAVPGESAQVMYLLPRYVIEPAATLQGRLETREAERQARRAWQARADDVSARLRATGLVIPHFAGSREREADAITVSIPMSQVEAVIALLSARQG